MSKLKYLKKCRTCKGTGKVKCTNPDHGFIWAMPGDIGRLGCPACGHNGMCSCDDCNGTGYVKEEEIEKDDSRN